MEQPPRRASIRQPYRKPSGVGHYGADLAGQWFDLRRKAQPHLGPDGIHHALRLCKHDRTWIIWRNEAFFPCVHLAALAVACVGQGSKTLPASPTGRLRLTRSPAASPCRNAPLARARLRPATDTRRILVSLKASSTTCCLKRMRSVPVERCATTCASRSLPEHDAPVSIDQRITAALAASKEPQPFAELRAVCHVRATTLYQRLAALTADGRVVKHANGYCLPAQ